MGPRPRLPRRARRPAADLRRPPNAGDLRPPVERAVRGSAHRLQARGPAAHRGAQVEQRARAGAPRPADAQDPGDRGDGRGPARRRHGGGRREDRDPVPRLHGSDRHGPAVAQRVAHAAARGRGRWRGRRVEDAEGRHQRGDARLERKRRDDALRARLGARTASVSDDGAAIPVRHRPRGARPVPQARRTRPARGRGVRGRRIERDRSLLRIPRDPRGPLRRRGGRQRRGTGRARGAFRGRSGGGPSRNPHDAPPGRGRAGAAHAFRFGGARLPGRGPGARGPPRPRPGDVRESVRLRGARRVRARLRARGDPAGPRVLSRGRLRVPARAEVAALVVDPRQPLGPRRQGPRRVSARPGDAPS